MLALVSAGTGIWSSQFFSARRNTLSESFQSPIWITGELIGQLSRSDTNEMTLIIRNIFDEEVYHNSFTLVNFTNVANPISSIVFMEYLGHGMLDITFLAGDNFYHKNATCAIECIDRMRKLKEFFENSLNIKACLTKTRRHGAKHAKVFSVPL